MTFRGYVHDGVIVPVGDPPPEGARVVMTVTALRAARLKKVPVASASSETGKAKAKLARATKATAVKPTRRSSAPTVRSSSATPFPVPAGFGALRNYFRDDDSSVDIARKWRQTTPHGSRP